ncbi:MAG: cobalamin-binding protein [Candidatus Nanohaloarchaea archaeon]
MRILSAAPSNTEILYALGLEDQIVGTTSLCDYPGAAREKPSIGGWSEGVNYNKIDELNPDIILLSDQLQDEQASKLSEKYEVLQVNPESLEEVFESIEKIGKRFNREKEASKIISEMKEEIQEINLEGKRIYCEEWMDPPMVSGNWIPGLIEAANGDYFIGEERSRELVLEKLKEFDPEYIFLNVCGAGENIDRNKILERSEWQEITAVKNEDIYVVNDALLNRPGPRIVDGLKEIEGFINP